MINDKSIARKIGKISLTWAIVWIVFSFLSVYSFFKVYMFAYYYTYLLVWALSIYGIYKIWKEYKETNDKRAFQLNLFMNGSFSIVLIIYIGIPNIL